MRVVVLGATGNAGTSLVRALGDEDAVDEIVGVARRLPTLTLPKTSWVAADIERSDLVSLFRGADCVVHLVWRIQPSHDVSSLRQTNVAGSERVLGAATWRLRLQPTPPGWLDMGLSVPMMDATRARSELGWEPRHSSLAAVLELLAGTREGAGAPTPALRPPSVKARL